MSRTRWIATLGAIAAAGMLVAWGVVQGSGPGQARHLLAQSRALQAQGRTAAARAILDQLLQRFPASGVADRALLRMGQLAEQSQDWLRAQQTYQRLLQEMPMSELAVQAQEALGNANIHLIFSSAVTSQDTRYVVQPGDTLNAIAKRFHTTIELIKRSNSLASDIIHQGMSLKIVGGAFSIVVDKSQNILLLKRGEEVLKQYTVSTGANNSTPVGTWAIVNRLQDPPWYTDHGVIPAGDPRNILGTRWLGFDKPGYGIHGTTDPTKLGSQVTAGCVRMRNDQVEELYDIIPESTRVTIID